MFGSNQPFQQAYTQNPFLSNFPNPSPDYNNNVYATNPRYFQEDNFDNQNDKKRYLNFNFIKPVFTNYNNFHSSHGSLGLIGSIVFFLFVLIIVVCIVVFCCVKKKIYTKIPQALNRE